jgi:hypothetical protein
MWCWRRMGKISWTDHVRNEEVLLRVNEQRTILHEIRKRKTNLIGHILRRNCLLKQVIEGKIKGELEVTRRRGRRCKKLLGDLKDRRWYSHLKEEALVRTIWRNSFGRGVGTVVRQNTEWMNVLIVCKCVLYYYHLVSTQLQLTNISTYQHTTLNSKPNYPRICSQLSFNSCPKTALIRRSKNGYPPENLNLNVEKPAQKYSGTGFIGYIT